MREIQGAICVASLVQVLLGFTGVIGILLRCASGVKHEHNFGLLNILQMYHASDHHPRCLLNWDISF